MLAFLGVTEIFLINSFTLFLLSIEITDGTLGEDGTNDGHGT